MRAICVRCSGLSRLPHFVEQRIAKFSVVQTHKLDCHSQRFDPLMRGRLSDLELAEQYDPYGVGVSQYENFLGSIHYSVGWYRSECHSV